jgi:hypothetical protein
MDAIGFIGLGFVGMEGSFWRHSCCLRNRWPQGRRHGACRRQSHRLQILLFDSYALIRTYVVDNVKDILT